MNSVAKTFAIIALVLVATVSVDSAFAQRHGPPGHGGHGGGPMIHPSAQSPHHAIYENLLVDEIDPNPGIVGAINREKTVGGLKCRKTMGFGPRGVRATRYSYEFTGRRRNDQRISFAAANVHCIHVHVPLSDASSTDH